MEVELGGACGVAVAAPCFLYYFLDADDRVLYVGMTDDFTVRRRAHAAKDWFRLVDHEIVMTYPDRVTCAAVEALVIHALRPPLNVAVPDGSRCATLAERAVAETPLPLEWVRQMDALRAKLREAEAERDEMAQRVDHLRRLSAEQLARARWAERELDRKWQDYLRPADRHEVGEWIWGQIGRVAYVEEFGGDREEALRQIACQLVGRRLDELNGLGDVAQPAGQRMLPVPEFLEVDTETTLANLGVDGATDGRGGDLVVSGRVVGE